MKNSTGNTHGEGTTSDSLDITESELNDILSRVNDCIARHDYTVLCGDKDDKPKNSNFLNAYDIDESQMLEIIKDLKWGNFCPPPMVAYDKRFKRSLLYVFKIEELLSFRATQYSYDNPPFSYDERHHIAEYTAQCDKLGIFSEEEIADTDLRNDILPSLSDRNESGESIDPICKERLVNIYIKFCLIQKNNVESLIVVSFHESTSTNSIDD